MAGIDLKSLARAMSRTDTILTPYVTEYMLTELDRALTPEVAQTIVDLLTTEPRERSKSFSASSAGKCDRAQVYGYLGHEQGVIDSQLANIFNDGKWRHLRWQAMLLMAGLLTDVEYPLFWNAKRTRGTMDGLGVVPDDHPRANWRGKEFGFELKGVSTFLFSKLVKSGAKEEHLDQVHRYFVLSGLELFVIMYEDKTTQAIHEWVIEPDPKRMAEQRNELEALNRAVDSEKLPKRLPECTAKKGAWKECPYGGSGGVCEKVVTYREPRNND